MTTVYVDRLGVKHVTPTYFNYRKIRNKKKDTNAVKMKYKQGTRIYEHNYRHK